MTDAPTPSYDEFPALDGPSNSTKATSKTQNAIRPASNINLSNSIINYKNNNNNNTNSTTTAVANSWSIPHNQVTAQASNNSPIGQQPQQPKLNYIILSNSQQIYQQQQQSQQVLNHHSVNQPDHNPKAMVSQYHLQPQQPQQTANINNNNNIINNNNNSTGTMQANPSTQQRRPGLPTPIISSERSFTFKIAPEERRHRDFELEQSKILKEIMQKTNTKIEVTTTKDGALNFCLYGKEANCQAAKNSVLNDFQTSVTLTVSVPKSIHGRLLGPKGARLASIQEETQTKIAIPRKDEDSDVIKIVGLKNNAEMAVRSIQKYAREFAGKAIEKVSVERIYLLFITGPFNENLKKWEEMGAKVSTSGGILPSTSDRESGHADEVTFTIVGETSVVSLVRDEISQIYEDKKKKCTTVNIEVKKAQHKYILGPGGQNLRSLFAKTGVSVELPHESESETITLRGERSKLAPALAELYTQAHSETDDFFEAETWLHKYLIGVRKTNYLDFKALGVDVKSLDDKIKLHGPPTEVENIKETLEAELQTIRKTIIRKDISVEPRIHGYIIGRAGATVEQIREESGAFIFVPKNDEPSEFITLEGTPEAVTRAEEKINAIAKKYEASRKLVIDQQLHGSIIGRGGEKIRSIREKFANVVFTFPEQGSKNNEITILGPSDEVEECYKYLDEFHQQLQENNHQVQVLIRKDIVKYIPDAQQAIKRIKQDHKVKVDLFLGSDGNKSASSTPSKQLTNASSATNEASVNENQEPTDGKKKSGKNNKASAGSGAASKKQKESQQSNGLAEGAKATKGSNNTNANVSGDNYAVVIGKKEDVDQAKVKLSKLFEELATTTEFEVKLSHKLRSLMGPKTKLYRQLLDEFQNKVVISFPSGKQSQEKQQVNKQASTGGDEVTSSDTNGVATSGNGGKGNNSNKDKDSNNSRIDTVKIRGPKNIAKKAEKRFEALVTECQDKLDKNFTTQVTIETAVIEKFLYSDKIKLNRIRDTQNVKLNIPDRRDTPNLVCSIIGYEKNVQVAQEQLTSLAKEVEERVEETIEIASQVHPRLIGSQGRAVKKLMDDYKILVKFARQGDPDPNSVILSGRRECVTAAKNHMLKLAAQYLSSSSGGGSRSGGGGGGHSGNGNENSGNNNSHQQQTAIEANAISGNTE